jgi:YjbE family integral membrane protein
MPHASARESQVSAGRQYEAQLPACRACICNAHAEPDLRLEPDSGSVEAHRGAVQPQPFTAPGSGLRSIQLELDMEFLSAPWWSALLAIILINLLLAGDNAVVIALAARNLPPRLRTKAIVWGTVGAIIVRSAMTLAIVWLLQIPGLMLAGGLGLLWIAYKLLLTGSHEGPGDGPVATTFWRAMMTIVAADALMGVDNVLGVAGAARGEFVLVVIGLVLSVPIVVLGSTLVLKLVQRFPLIIQVGAAMLAFTAAGMIIAEPVLEDVFDHFAVRWATYAVAISGVLAAAACVRRRSGAPTKS